jgi:hypothetical protein
MINRYRKYFLLVFVLIVSSWALAGDQSNIRGVSMGHAIVAGSRGTECLSINPANLAVSDRSRFSLSIIPFGMTIRTDLFVYDTYQKYFTGIPGPDGKRVAKKLTDADKNDIFSQLPDIGTTRMDIEAQLIGISFQHPKIGGVGFAITEHLGMNVKLSRDYFRFMAFGLDSLGSEYRFDGTGFSAWWWREYNLSYGRKLPFKIKFLKSLHAGIGLKLIRGYGYFETEHYYSTFGNYRLANLMYEVRGKFDYLTRRSGIDMFNSDKDAGFSLFPDPAGKGFGVDIGLSSEVRDGLRVGLSVTDIGSITWDKNIVETYASESVTFAGDFSATEDSLKDASSGKNRTGQSFSTTLPTRLRFGATMDAKQIKYLKFVPGKLLLAFDYTQGFNESLGNTKKARFSLGMEYRIIPFVPIRTGLVLGGGDKARWAFGFGFNFKFFDFDLASDNFTMLFSPKSLQMFSVSMGMKIRV